MVLTQGTGEEGYYRKYGKWVTLALGGGRQQARKGIKEGHREALGRGGGWRINTR